MNFKEVVSELFSSPTSIVTVAVAVVLLICGIVKLFKSKSVSGALSRVKKVKTPVFELELGADAGKTAKESDTEQVSELSKKSTIQIDKYVFEQVVQDCIDKAVCSAFERVDIQLSLKEEQIQHVKEELDNIVNIEAVEYSELLEQLGDIIETERMSDLYTYRIQSDFDKVGHNIEEKLDTSLLTKTDEDLKELSSTIINRSIPALKLAFSRYNIAHKNEAKEIFERHLVDVERVIRETIEASRQMSLDSQKQLKRKIEDFNQGVAKTLQNRGLPHNEGDVWNDRTYC